MSNDLEECWALVRPEGFSEGRPVESAYRQPAVVTPEPEQQAQTISCWFRCDAPGEQELVASAGQYRLQLVEGELGFEVEGEGAWHQSVRSWGTYNDGLWHHAVVLVRQPDREHPHTVWIDAVAAEVRSAPQLSKEPGSFSGHIDDFAVWDRELTEDEIRQIYNGGSPTEGTLPQNGLVAHYRMGEDPLNQIRMGLDPGIQPGSVVRVNGCANEDHNGDYVVTNVTHQLSAGSQSNTGITIAPGTFVGRDGRRYELEESVTIPPGGKVAVPLKRWKPPRSSWERILDDLL